MSEPVCHQKLPPNKYSTTPPIRYNVSLRQPLLPTPFIPRLTDINFQNPAIGYGSAPLAYSPRYTGAVPKKKTEYNQGHTFKKRENRMDYTETNVNTHSKTPPLNQLPELETKTSPVKSNDVQFHQAETNLMNYSLTNLMNYSLSQKTINTESTSKQSSNNLEDVVYYSEDEDNFTDEEVAEPALEISINYNVPFNVQENLRTLITQNTDGIWCSYLPKLYKEKFNKSLDYAEYGYRSLIHMCLDLENLFHCYRPARGDFILHDNTIPLSQEAKDEIEQRHFTESIKTTKRLTESNNTEPALVDVEVCIYLLFSLMYCFQIKL